jgi:hypothetical protein
MRSLATIQKQLQASNARWIAKQAEPLQLTDAQRRLQLGFVPAPGAPTLRSARDDSAAVPNLTLSLRET